ncbi:MAG: hypothetical protein ACM33B_16435 [Pseudomonadota bacterium]
MRALVVALAATLVVAAAPASGVDAQARLRLVADSPLSFAGSGFAGRESVRVRLVAPALRTQVVRTGPGGRFVVRIADPGCLAGLVHATARGLRSGRAASYRRLGPGCPAP